MTSPYRGIVVEAFKPGDVVRLKSGGPDMTVERSSAAGTVDCVWFVHADSWDDDDGVYGQWSGPFRGPFLAEILEAVDDPR